MAGVQSQQSLNESVAEPRLAGPSSRAVSGKRFRLPAAVLATVEGQAWEQGW